MPISIGNMVGLPGRSINGNWDVIDDSDGNSFSLSMSIHTGKTGNLRILVATGPEYSSSVAENALIAIAETIDPSKINGTLITLHDFADRWSEIPHSDKPAYPGWPSGDMAERVAFEMFNQLFKHVDYALFLEGPTPGMSNLPHAAVYTYDNPPMTSCHPEILKMMGHDLILQKDGMRGSLVIEAQRELGLPVLVAQLDDVEPNPDTENYLKEKVLNFLAWVEFFDFKPLIPDKTYVATQENEIRSVRDGDMEFNRSLGEFVSAGDILGVIKGRKETDRSEIENDFDGYIVRHRHPGTILTDDVICSLLGVSFLKDSPGRIVCRTALDNAQMDVNLRENLLFKSIGE